MSANQQVLVGLSKPKSQKEFTTPGTYTFEVPSGVTSISVVAISGGEMAWPYPEHGGGGGSLAYKNNIAVTPGEVLTVLVGRGAYINQEVFRATSSSLSRGSVELCSANPGSGSTGGSTGVGDVISAGGNGAPGSFESIGGGGGAAGYSGKGGDGVESAPAYQYVAGKDGSGGGGGGGKGSAGGGGVGIYGQGANGAGGVYYGGGGGGGSGGAMGNYIPSGSVRGGNFGGGSGGRGSGPFPEGGGGAVRIIWPGNLRQFPSTRTADE